MTTDHDDGAVDDRLEPPGARQWRRSTEVLEIEAALFSATIDARTGLDCTADEIGQLAARSVVGLPDDD